MNIKISDINWNKTYRLISTRFPPIDLFERVADKNEWEDICNYESAHNPRLRNTLFTFEESVYGNGASYVMAPFYYNLPAGRFTTERFGGYYAANTDLTAVYEKAYHVGLFYSDSYEEEGIIETYQMLVGKIGAQFHDLTSTKDNDIYSPVTYDKSHEIAIKLFNQGSDGIVYNSVRNPEGLCFVAYKPKIVPIPIHGIKPVLYWDGNKISKWFNGKSWSDVNLIV